MKKFAQLIAADLKRIFRDRTLLVFLLTPVFLVLFVRLAVPVVSEHFPVIIPYHPQIMMFASAQTAIMFGFITAFIILDEKDENTLQVIRILPISPGYFILFRLGFGTLFSFAGAMAMMELAGIAFPGHFKAFLLALQFALTAPLITLIVGAYARNKIEGMAFFKGVDLLLVLPVLSFFIDSGFKYAFGIVPAFWTYQAYDLAIGHSGMYLHYLAGCLVYAVALAVLTKQFRKRVFDR